MSEQLTETLEPLIDHLARTTVLSHRDAGRVVVEVMAFFDQALEEFVRARHGVLKAEGLRNDAIFRQVAEDIAAWRFAAPPITERQVRRMIYG